MSTTIELAGGLSVPAGAAVLAAAALCGFLAGALLAARGRPGGRRVGAGLCLALAALALTAAILRPSAVAVGRQLTPARAIVLIDRSASMLESDLPGGRERWRAAADALAEGAPLRGVLARRATATFLGFDSSAAGLEPAAAGSPPAGGATDVCRALEAAFTRPGPGPLAGVVVYTDGRATRGSPLELRAAEFATRRVPFWVVGAGAERAGPRPGLAVADMELPESAAVGEAVDAGATVRASGLAGRKVVVRLMVDGREAGRRELSAASAEARLPVRLGFTPRAEGIGRVELVAECPAAGADRPAASARSSRYIAIRGRALRVLYAEGRLGWGYRELAASLGAAPRAEVETWAGFVAEPPGTAPAGPGLAARMERLDVVVLGDVPASALGREDLAALARAVREDGLGLVFAAGPESAATYAGTPLEALLPAGLRYPAAGAERRQVVLPGGGERPAALRLDPAAPEDHRLWSSLPETAGAWTTGAPRPGAAVWLRAGADPLLVAWQAGRGRAAQLAWPDHWRWARAGEAGAEAHRRLFSRLAAWLSGREEPRGERLALSMPRYRLVSGDEAVILARLTETPPGAGRARLSARVEPGAERAGELELIPVGPDAWRLTLPAGRPGEYRAAVTARAAGKEWAQGEIQFAVEASDAETGDTSPDFGALRRLAADTGGAFLTAAEAGRLPEILERALPRPPERERLARRPLWDSAWLLAAALFGMCAAWALVRGETGG